MDNKLKGAYLAIKSKVVVTISDGHNNPTRLTSDSPANLLLHGINLKPLSLSLSLSLSHTHTHTPHKQLLEGVHLEVTLDDLGWQRA